MFDKDFLDYGARTHISEYGSFISGDPLESQIPYQSPYIYAGNNPILYIDAHGRIKLSKKDLKEFRMHYPTFIRLIDSDIFVKFADKNDYIYQILVDLTTNKSTNNNFRNRVFKVIKEDYLSKNSNWEIELYGHDFYTSGSHGMTNDEKTSGIHKISVLGSYERCLEEYNENPTDENRDIVIYNTFFVLVTGYHEAMQCLDFKYNPDVASNRNLGTDFEILAFKAKAERLTAQNVMEQNDFSKLYHDLEDLLVESNIISKKIFLINSSPIVETKAEISIEKIYYDFITLPDPNSNK